MNLLGFGWKSWYLYQHSHIGCAEMEGIGEEQDLLLWKRWVCWIPFSFRTKEIRFESIPSSMYFSSTKLEKRQISAPKI